MDSVFHLHRCATSLEMWCSLFMEKTAWMPHTLKNKNSTLSPCQRLRCVSNYKFMLFHVFLFCKQISTIFYIFHLLHLHQFKATFQIELESMHESWLDSEVREQLLHSADAQQRLKAETQQLRVDRDFLREKVCFGEVCFICFSLNICFRISLGYIFYIYPQTGTPLFPPLHSSILSSRTTVSMCL